MSQPKALPRAQARTITGGPDDRLLVLAGRLWVTRTGEATDRFLGPGDSMALGFGRVVIEADGCEVAHYRVSPSACWVQPAPRRRLSEA